MKETDLYPPVKAFLEAQGYEVKGEIRDADVVARRGVEEPVIVELKTSFGLPLLIQGVARQSISDAVYLAFPSETAGGVWKKQRREAQKLCRRLGLGVLLVHLDREPALVEPVLDPARYQPRQNARRRAMLLREFERRKGDPSPGGGNKQPIMTAYRQDALTCAKFIAEQADKATASPKEIKAATGVEKAAAILQKDVYGWFIRVDRGAYTLSDKGRQALGRYADAPHVSRRGAAS